MFKAFSFSITSSHLGDQIWSRTRTCKLSKNDTSKLFKSFGLLIKIPTAKEKSFGTNPLIKSIKVNSSTEYARDQTECWSKIRDGIEETRE